MVYSQGDDVNCIIAVQINEQSFEVTYQQVKQGLWGLQDSCRPQALGGSSVSTNGKWSIIVTNNPDYRGSSTTAVARRSVAADSGSLDGSRLVPQVHSLSTRGDGDDGFSVGIHSVGVPGGRNYVGYGMPGQGKYKTTKSDTKSFTYTTSMEVSADILKIVSVKVGFEFSTTKSSTTTEGAEITFFCATNENAYLYLEPLYEVWSGALTPSGEKLSVSRPQTNNDGHVLAQYGYECRA